jgi:branched-chain amino acid transport system substrate-binding protein
VVLAFLAGCGNPARVGAIVSRTGAASSSGEQIARGFDLAVDGINAKGGVGGRRLELLYRDDSTNPEIGVAALRELFEHDHVTTVLGAVTSTVTLRLAPYCEKNRVVLMSPSASASQLSGAGEYIFRTVPSDVLEGASMADFARDLGLDRIAVFRSTTITARASPRPSRIGCALRAGASWRRFRFPKATKPRSRTPWPLWQVWRRVGSTSRHMPATSRPRSDCSAGRASGRSSSGTSAAASEPVRTAGPAAENLVFPRSSFDPAADSVEVTAFTSAFRTRYAAEPDVYAARAYDTVGVLAAAAASAGSWDPDKIRDALLLIDNYEGVTGRLAFDRNGDVVQYPRLYIVRGGQFIPYDRFVEGGGALPVPGR